MKAFFAPMRELGEFEAIESRLAGNHGMFQVTGCIDSQKAHFIASLGQDWPIRLVIPYSEQRAKELCENYSLFDRDILYFPAKDLIFFQADIHGNLLEQQRLAVLKALAERRTLTVVTTMSACMNHLMPHDAWTKEILLLAPGDTLDMEEMKHRLTFLGYERMGQVDAPGQFAVRGGILDIYPLTDENPVRIELWGDEIDSIRSFDVQSQRSLENLESLTLYPAAELLPSARQREAVAAKVEKEAKKQEQNFLKNGKQEEAARIRRSAQESRDELLEMSEPLRLESFLDYFCKSPCSFLDYFPEKSCLIFLDEPNRILDQAQAVETEFRESMKSRLEKGYSLPGQTGLLFSFQETAAWICSRRSVGMCTLENARAPWESTAKFSLTVHSVNPYNNSFELLVQDLKKWKKEGYRVILLAASRTRGQRLAGDLMEEGLSAFYTEDPERITAPGEILVTHGNARRGYEYPLIRFVILAESDIFGQEKKKKKRLRRYEGKQISSFSELSVGDYVVHENHGLGIYRGIDKVEVDHVTKDYMKIEYSGGSCLFVPATSLDAIQKYADQDAKPPRLNRLGTQEWNRTKSHVRTAVRSIAQDLVRLYAARSRPEGFVYGQDTVWQREFEEMFPYEETDDQAAAIEAVKKDMESDRIMDRLVCGDVGFGKTEIAIRAAFKAVQEGKQVAYLVPTTILAQQHYNTFIQRMKDYPVRVDLMSRFRSAAEQKQTITDLKKGLVDIVIGTHRLLSKDVVFKDLGLLVIDEEQRFGVTHKEKIKQMKQQIDVLTLTATPIPRTLHMSLIGIRDMSILEEAPQDRLPIQTYVMEYNEEMVREAITRELARGGQVYYVYNRVNSIVEMANNVAALVPEANVAFAHGQMKERELERIMFDFINGEIDVLVSTTIIETGLDIPNVNTMIIHDADTMGLSQLYQLRGRVGRSSRTSYAFFMYRRNKMLREVAEKRLTAIREFTELGSGIKIAMRDLEIRGAGNLLGSEQSGHMAAVGYDLYCKLLNESVKELKENTEPADLFDTSMDLDIDAYIPDRYIPNEHQKLDIYKRIAAVQGQDDYDDMLEELIDRFGEPPRCVLNLLQVAKMRGLAHAVFLTEIAQKGDVIRFSFYDKARIRTERLDPFLRDIGSRLKFHIGSPPYLTYVMPRKPAEDPLRVTGEILDKMQALVEA